MRDIALSLIVFGLIPFILVHPYIGVLVWTWLSMMSPHRLAYGFAHDFPFAHVVAVATFIGIVVTKDRKSFPVNAITVTLLLFVLWMCVTSLFSIYPEATFPMWMRVMKIQIMLFLTIVLLHKLEHVDWFIWVMVASLGFYGAKGGIFTFIRSGDELVWGPPGSYIEGNNELGLALIMTIPLMRYLQMRTQHVWIRRGLWGAMLLSAIAALGTHSRGALVAIGAMSLALLLKSRNKIVLAIAIMVTAVIGISIMPAKWVERMHTISAYESDGSVRGRFNAWAVAYGVAKDRPAVGGGFEIYTREIFDRYAPNKDDAVRAAHSIYFQVLGEHGFVGLGLFLLIWFFTWRGAAWIYWNAPKGEEYAWARDVSSMVQVSLVGYGVGGAALSLSYFDLPYNLLAIVVIAREIIRREIAGNVAVRDAPRRVRAFGKWRQPDTELEPFVAPSARRPGAGKQSTRDVPTKARSAPLERDVQR
jgi:putative inorganic carbon (hco3(-)) transporter